MKSIPIVIVCTAVFMAGTVTRAQAQNNDRVLSTLAGLVALGLVAKAIDDHNDRDRARASAARNATRLGPTTQEVWGQVAPRSQRPQRQSLRLPNECRRRILTDHGDRFAYARGCLNRTYAFSDQIPASCSRQVRTQRGTRTVYGARCLQRNGFRVEARRDD